MTAIRDLRELGLLVVMCSIDILVGRTRVVLVLESQMCIN